MQVTNKASYRISMLTEASSELGMRHRHSTKASIERQDKPFARRHIAFNNLIILGQDGIAASLAPNPGVVRG